MFTLNHFQFFEEQSTAIINILVLISPNWYRKYKNNKNNNLFVIYWQTLHNYP